MRSSIRSAASALLAAAVALLPAAPSRAADPPRPEKTPPAPTRANGPKSSAPDAGVAERTSDPGPRGTAESPDAGAHVVLPPQPTEAEQIARAEFERAQRAYDLGRFDEAIGHYGRAYEAMPLPPLLFNIAQCHRLLGEYAQAAFFYRRYLDLAGNPANAGLTRELLSEMEQRQSQAERDASARAREALAHGGEGAGIRTPVYKNWWFWALVGGAVAAGVTTVAVVSQPEPTTLGTLNAR